MAAAPASSLAAQSALLDIVERALHAKSEWMFLRELRVGTGRSHVTSLQRVDGFALHTLPHTGMKRICYEVKCSRADFLNELKQPLKRRIGMRYSNEFYFVTPPGLVKATEVPAECGLIEAGMAPPEEARPLLQGHAGFFHYDPDRSEFCVLRIPAPWRDTPGPTWQLLAAMLRHQRRELEERPPAPPAQQKLELS